MFWLRNKKNDFLLHTLFLGPAVEDNKIKPYQVINLMMPSTGNKDYLPLFLYNLQSIIIVSRIIGIHEAVLEVW